MDLLCWLPQDFSEFVKGFIRRNHSFPVCASEELCPVLGKTHQILLVEFVPFGIGGLLGSGPFQSLEKPLWPSPEEITVT